ncbi:6738_t:CDS:2, partial [Gigaspora margarita]
MTFNSNIILAIVIRVRIKGRKSRSKGAFEFIYPLIKLPLQKQLSGQILAESIQKITKSTKEIAQNDKNRKNVKKESIFGSILVISIGKVLVWNAENISDEHTKWPDVQCRTENMLSDLKIEKIKVNAIVTDCASEYEHLHSEQAALYKSYISFVSPNSTHWNSYYLCFASIIKSRAALKNLATKIEEENNNNLKDFPRNILFNISMYQVIKDIPDEELKDYLIVKLEKR